MRKVTIVQTHNATVTQTDVYEVSDDLIEVLGELPSYDREMFVIDNGEQTTSETEIKDIHDTIDVEVTW